MLKIAIIGPESTGKSELAKALAAHFKSPWIPEFAREYVENLARPYTFEDVCIIAKKQIEDEIHVEKDLTSNSKYTFFDTDLIITKVWLSYCYDNIPSFINKRLEKGFIDIYLLCAPDIPWVADSVREHGSDRDFFFNWYKEEIIKLGKPFLIVEGDGEKRTQLAIDFLIELNRI